MTLPTIERLFQRVAAAEKSQQKDIRLSIQEAHELATELAGMTMNLGKTVTEIHGMLAEIKESSTSVEVKFDGGGF
jgi:predicted trehalose synthase